MQQLRCIHGNYVTGANFWNREQEQQELLSKIELGMHTSIIAPRRMGKTSLMHEVSRKIQDRYICLHIDFQNCSSPAQAIRNIVSVAQPHTGLWNRLGGLFKNVRGSIGSRLSSIKAGPVGIDLREGIKEGDWQKIGNRVFAQLAGSEKPVIMFCDEFPVLLYRILKTKDEITVEGHNKADLFLSWLRANAIRHQNKVILVLTGSIGLQPLMSEAYLSGRIDIYRPLVLRPWKKQVALDFLEALAGSYHLRFPLASRERMLENLGQAIPHFTQLYFDNLLQCCQEEGIDLIEPAFVDMVYQERLLRAPGMAELNQVRERLLASLGERRRVIAEGILKEAARQGMLTPEELEHLKYKLLTQEEQEREIFEIVMHVLEHDGYLHEVDDGLTFKSNLVRDWWYKSSKTSSFSRGNQ